MMIKIPIDQKYLINSDGVIINSITLKEIKQHVNSNGYKYVQLSKKKKHSLHRIIALCFIPNPENKPCVNHINGIKTDNRLENLEWATHSENNKHAYSNNLRKPVSSFGGGWLSNSKKVAQYDKNGNFIRIFKSCREAAILLGKSANGVNKCARGELKTSYGYIWKFA